MVGDQENMRCGSNGDEENRELMVEEQLINCCAIEIALKINKLVEEHCLGCISNFCSQLDHDCLMLEADERVYRYFDTVQSVTTADIVERFMGILKDTQIAINVLELIKYISDEWLQQFTVMYRRCIKRKVLEMCDPWR